MHIILDNTRCSKCAIPSGIVHGAKPYLNIVVTSHLNTRSVPHDRHEAMVEACYNCMWGGPPLTRN